MKFIILSIFILIAGCKDDDSSTSSVKDKNVGITISKEESPDTPPFQKKPTETPVKFNLNNVKEVEFKLLTDYDLPLADQKFAEKSDLESIKNGIPVSVRRLNKQFIKIKGFMVPLELNEDNKVSAFLLAPDQTSCLATST